MKVGIVSDTHDNWPHIKKACNYFNKENINILIHCGDLCAPVTLRKCLAVEFKGQIHIIKGNVDGDQYLNYKRAEEFDNVSLYHEEIGEFEIDAKKIAIQHYPKLARGLAFTGDYDAVFYGHNHKKSQEYIKVEGKEVLLANPGNLCDIIEPASFGIYNTESNTLEIIDIKNLNE